MQSANYSKIFGFFNKRIIETIGSLTVLLSIFLLLSLSTYTPEDPNFIFPEKTKIQNLFGGNRTDWTYNEKNIIKYINIYKDLMQFWKNKIGNYIYELKYEDLVENKEIEIKKILEFCDLNWQNNCLEFYNKKNPIKTVSINQSRKPIYKDSVNKSNNYKDFLNLFNDLI